MSAFKDQIAKDNTDVFMNLEEFPDKHSVNGKEITVMFDNYELIDREKRYQHNRGQYSDGVFLKELLIYVLEKEFGPLPAIGRILTLDGKTYVITDSINEDGIYSLTLEANKTTR